MVGVVLPDTDQRSAASFAERAEALGYSSVWLGELWGENVFAHLGAVAERTDDVTLGTAIANVYSRTPAVLAMGAASLDRLSGGRFRLGVGASTPAVVEGLHGVTYDRPVRRTEETVELVARLLGDGDTVEYDGELVGSSGFPPLSTPVPIDNAALGPANRRLTGHRCDGWLPNNLPLSGLADAFEPVADAAREAGRDASDVRVMPWIHAAVSDDGETANKAVRAAIAYYVGSGEGYRRAVATVYPDAADRISSAWNDGDHDAARAHVTDDVVADLAVAGTPEAARTQLDGVRANPVVDEPILAIPPRMDDGRIKTTVEALAPG